MLSHLPEVFIRHVDFVQNLYDLKLFFVDSDDFKFVCVFLVFVEKFVVCGAVLELEFLDLG